MPRYHLTGTIEIWDIEWYWHGKRATRGEVVALEGTIIAASPRAAIGLAAQQCLHGWAYWEPHDLTVTDLDTGRQVLRDDRLATFQQRHGAAFPWLLLAEGAAS